ncbi:low affinity immunoglobulin gamma Fc region receptor III-like [Morone saxatilis]|uniref:low affinity immunoglobulin gamma Fc region receptor III-like n=1 Tax=Morone saxatilis TaxID=34816 RepID=UPI0015E2255A|nr:low affinity immunoglobulin gamma Fc region receptor III-like [Morone saxatilis]
MPQGVHTEVDPAFWIIPTRLQLFEYESLSFKCSGFDGLTGWNILRKNKAEIAPCNSKKWSVSNESSCRIRGAFPEDSGEYWCEDGERKRSNSVHINVTGGLVILESPVLPVMKGDAVTLRCRTKTSSNLTADFYKDGLLIGSSFTKETTIYSVSESDEGLYKCIISDVGESAESWLTVRELHTETHPSPDQMLFIFRTIFPIVLMAVLLMLLGLLHYGKFGGSRSRCVSCCDCINK